jgi:hypothetical protein
MWHSLLSWRREKRERSVPFSQILRKGGNAIFPPLLVTGRTGNATFPALNSPGEQGRRRSPLFTSSGEEGTLSSLLSRALKRRERGIPCSPAVRKRGKTTFPLLRFSGKGSR